MTGNVALQDQSRSLDFARDDMLREQGSVVEAARGAAQRGGDAAPWWRSALALRISLVLAAALAAEVEKYGRSANFMPTDAPLPMSSPLPAECSRRRKKAAHRKPGKVWWTQ